MRAFFHKLLYIPLYNLLIAIVSFMPGHDLGLAIVLITIIIRLILHPFSISAFRSQRLMQRIQPKLNELKAKHKDDKQAFTQATMALYKEHKINPASSCLPLLLQLPILLALYWVLTAGLKSIDVSILYSFTPRPDAVSSLAFGFLNLQSKSYVLAVLAGAAQFWQTRMLQTPKPPIKTEGSKDEAMMSMVNKQMLYFMPVVTIIIGIGLPAGLTLYWLLATLLTVLQQWYIFRGLDREEELKKQSN